MDRKRTSTTASESLSELPGYRFHFFRADKGKPPIIIQGHQFRVHADERRCGRLDDLDVKRVLSHGPASKPARFLIGSIGMKDDVEAQVSAAGGRPSLPWLRILTLLALIGTRQLV